MDDLITIISNLKNQYVDGNGSGKSIDLWELNSHGSNVQ